MRQIILIAHNLRSAYNVGSIIRSAEGMGVNEIWLTGYTPYPIVANDDRLTHIANKVHKLISKTSLGAEEKVKIVHKDNVLGALQILKQDGFNIIGLEQTPKSIDLLDYKPSPKIGLIVGREVEGIETEILQNCDEIVEIPMLGTKESYNVSVAAAIALFSLRFVHKTV